MSQNHDDVPLPLASPPHPDQFRHAPSGLTASAQDEPERVANECIDQQPVATNVGKDAVVRSLKVFGVGVLLILALVFFEHAVQGNLRGRNVLVFLIVPVLGLGCCVVGAYGVLRASLKYRMYKTFLLTLTIVVAYLGYIAFGVYFFVGQSLAAQADLAHERAVRAAFKTKEALAPLLSDRNLRDEAEGKPYLKGKIVVLLARASYADGDLAGRFGQEIPSRALPPWDTRIGDVQFRLPHDLQAETPADVDTVVWVRVVRKVVAAIHRKGGGDGSVGKYVVTVTAIDREASAIVAKHQITGQDPPAPGGLAPDGWQQWSADEEVLAFLLDLPRR